MLSIAWSYNRGAWFATMTPPEDPRPLPPAGAPTAPDADASPLPVPSPSPDDPDLAPTSAIATPALAHLSALLLPGDILGDRFRIVGFLGRGGMGEVYEAEDLEVGGRVALKAIRQELAAAEGTLERFKREIHLARKVTHRHVCRIFDIGRHRGEAAGREVTFLTMELLPGQTLAERLRAQGSMSADQAYPLVAQLGEGLAAAHRTGVVHRDFKPGNVILVPSAEGPRAVITDFGIACLSSEGPFLSQEGRPLLSGTAGYLAPELAKGGRATPASDIYSFGVAIHEMLTGARPPSHHKSIDDARLDRRSRAVILRCMATDPSLRFASATDVAKALAGEEPSRRSRAVRRAGVAIAGFVLASALALLWRDRSRPASAPPPTPVQVTTSSGLDVFPSFSPDGKSLAYASDRNGGFRIYVRTLAPGGSETALTSEGESVQPAWSPDGEWIAYHASGAGIWIVPAKGGEARKLVDLGSHPAWSPDGDRIAFQSQPLVDLAANAVPALSPSTIWVVSRDGGAARPLTRPGEPPGGHGAPSWSPDGRRIVFSTADRRIAEIWSVAASGGHLARLVQNQPYAFDPAYAPDGRSVYYCSWSGRFTYGIWKVPVSPGDGRPEGLPSEVVNLGPLRLRHAAVSRDGRRVAYSALTLTSNLWWVPLSPASREPAGGPRPLTAETGKTARPSFSPDGRRLAFDRGRPGNPTDIWVMDAAGGGAVPLTSHRAEDDLPSWFPGGDRLAFLSDRSGRFAVWSVRVDGTGEELLLDVDQDIDWPRLSPDGRQIAFNSKRGTGTINTWLASLPRGEPRQLTFDAETMGFPAWSPDGARLALEVKRGESTHVAVISASGGAPVQLTFDQGESWPHSWSPDGEAIAFAGLRNGFWNIWSVSRSTREQRRLTHHAKLNTYVRTPAWSPNGDRIVYEYAETTGNVWMIDNPR